MNFVLYHAGCCDGYAAAFAAWLKSARYLPVRYREPLPALEGASPEQPAEVPYRRFQLSAGGVPYSGETP